MSSRLIIQQKVVSRSQPSAVLNDSKNCPDGANCTGHPNHLIGLCYYDACFKPPKPCLHKRQVETKEKIEWVLCEECDKDDEDAKEKQVSSFSPPSKPQKVTNDTFIYEFKRQSREAEVSWTCHIMKAKVQSHHLQWRPWQKKLVKHSRRGGSMPTFLRTRNWIEAEAFYRKSAAIWARSYPTCCYSSSSTIENSQWYVKLVWRSSEVGDQSYWQCLNHWTTRPILIRNTCPKAVGWL